MVIVAAIVLIAIGCNTAWSIGAFLLLGTPLSPIDSMCIGATGVIAYSKLCKGPVKRILEYRDSEE